MQTQPRGMKRGAKQDIDAGGKKSKKEENEEEPKPFVCAIYRRDIASFLPREKIQQWRLSSSFSNASLIEFPSRLPRFKYSRVAVIFASADRCRVKKDGFLHQESDRRSMWGKEFGSIYKFRLCCSDVKERASELIGQRLFPSKPDNEGVAFKHYVDEPVRVMPKTVVCRVPNLLTEKTAPAMLHFLHHLSQACYECVEIIPGATADAAECALNPLVLQALPKFRLRGVKFGRASNNSSGELSNLTAKMASQMRIRYNLLYYYSWNFNFGMDLPQLLDFIANGRYLDKRLELQGFMHHNQQDVDQIIKYFEEDARSLEGAIQDVRYQSTFGFHDHDGWPERCPTEAATQVTERDDGTVDYRFDYTNAHSKEPFSLLLLGALRYEERTKICKFRLKFGST